MNRRINTEIGNYATELLTSKSNEEAFAAFSRLITGLGFDSALYSYIPSVVLENPSHLQPVFQVSNSYDIKYLDLYTEAELHKHDHVIHSISNGGLEEIDWWQEAQYKELTKNSLDVFSIARADHYMENGYTIPTLTGAQGIAAASFISSDKQLLFNLLLDENKTLIRIATKLLHNHIVGSHLLFSSFFAPALPKQLNKTEQIVLKHLCNGHRPAQIAILAHKNEKYVENVIRNIRMKFAGHDENYKPRISTTTLVHHCGLLGYVNSL